VFYVGKWPVLCPTSAASGYAGQIGIPFAECFYGNDHRDRMVIRNQSPMEGSEEMKICENGSAGQGQVEKRVRFR